MLAASAAPGPPAWTARAAPAAQAWLSSTARLVSASWCLSAWKEPIGRPKATRSLLYCTLRSNRYCMAPTVSATDSTQASWSWAPTAGPAAPSLADDVGRGGATHVVEPDPAQPRVRSRPDSTSTVSPGAVRGQQELGRAARVRAAVTRSQSAAWASMTKPLAPVSR